MDASELCKLLRVDRDQLNSWIAEGLPWTCSNHRRKHFDAEKCGFDPDDVADWLKAKGYFRERLAIARSVGEVARHFKVSKRAVYQWLETGCPRSPDGFDLDEIEAWHEAKTGRGRETTPEAANRARYEAERARIRAEREQLELDKEYAKTIDVETPVQIFTSHIAEVKAHLEQLPDFALSLLPPSIAAEIKRGVRDGLAKRIDEIGHVLARSLEEWAEAIDEAAR